MGQGKERTSQPSAPCSPLPAPGPEIRPAGLPAIKCWKCHREARGVDVPINGNRLRVDCEHCGYFLRWGRWWENHERHE